MKSNFGAANAKKYALFQLKHHQFGREPLFLGAPARISWSGRSKPSFIPSWEQPHSVPVPLLPGGLSPSVFNSADQSPWVYDSARRRPADSDGTVLNESSLTQNRPRDPMPLDYYLQLSGRLTTWPLLSFTSSGSIDCTNLAR